MWKKITCYPDEGHFTCQSTMHYVRAALHMHTQLNSYVMLIGLYLPLTIRLDIACPDLICPLDRWMHCSILWLLPRGVVLQLIL